MYPTTLGRSVELHIARIVSFAMLVMILLSGFIFRVPFASAVTGDACVPTELIAYWNLDEGSGTTAVDVTTNTNDGTLTNGPAYTASSAPTGYDANPFAVSFDGTDDYIALPSNVGLFDLSEPFTVAAWINPTLDATDQVFYGNAWATPGYQLRVNTANKVRFILITNGSNYNGIDSSVLSVGWHHVVGTWDGVSSLKMYIDGVEDSALPITGGTVTTITTTVSTNIGRSPEAGFEQYYDGDMDDVRVYGVALSASDVTELYDGCPDPDTLDFGDAEDPSYPTLLASDGARHTLGGSLWLGATVDDETDGQPSVGADGDDTDSTDDEDGVTFTSVLLETTNATVDVVASTGGLLDAWVDFDADGSFEAGEQIFTNQALIAGVNALSFPVPSGAAVGTTTARFRVSTAGSLAPTGLADDGEVEDYTVTIATLCNGFVPTIIGTNGNDFINGTNGPDIIHSLGGNDLINGKNGNDTICSGAGDDLVNGGNDDDWIDAGSENDILNGNNGEDILKGGGGHDILNGHNGKDLLTGGEGDDTVNGHNGDDTMKGDGGSDILNGDAGKDDIRGGSENDIVNGQNGADDLFGDEGNDILNGGQGNDDLDGGADSDICDQNQGSGTIANCTP